MIIETVVFESGEQVHAFYINGQLIKYGDHYHNKMEEWIQGFLDGVEHSLGYKVKEFKYKCTDEEMNDAMCDLGDSPPQFINNIIKDPIVR